MCGPGVFECNGAMMPVCNTGPGGTMSQAQTELCNGQNDDCDGATDEGFDVGTSCDPVGECGIGTIERPNDPGAGLTFGCVNGTGGNNAGNAITDARICYIRVYRGTGSATCIPYVINVRAGAAS